MQKFLISLVDFYQVFLSFDRGILSVFAPGGACKYSPTCSEYTKQYIKRFGVWKGMLFGLRRIWRCR